MKKFIASLLVNTLALFVVASLVPGVMIDGWHAALVAALLLALFNAVLKPLLLFVTCPLTVMTLGLFTLFVNAFIFFLVARLVEGFSVYGFWSAFWGAFVLSALNLLLTMMTGVKVIRAGRSPVPPARPAKYDKVIDAEVVPTKDDTPSLIDRTH